MDPTQRVSRVGLRDGTAAASRLGAAVLCLLWMFACQLPRNEAQSSSAPGETTGTLRILSLDPTLTESMFAIGAGDLLVGRSDYCKRPEAAAPLPTFGTSLTPNLEAIARLKPDRILVK